MKGGANTFPFHNLLPYSESNEGLFLFFSPSLNWINEKSVATLAIRNICDTKISKSVHRITVYTSRQLRIENKSTLQYTCISPSNILDITNTMTGRKHISTRVTLSISSLPHEGFDNF